LNLFFSKFFLINYLIIKKCEGKYNDDLELFKILAKKKEIMTLNLPPKIVFNGSRINYIVNIVRNEK